MERLKPETEYSFKLRVWRDSDNQFTTYYEFITIKTNDEADLRKAELQLLKAVKDNKHEVIESICNKFGTEVRQCILYILN